MASEFLDRLEKGEFTVPVCTLCGKKAWPPAAHCPSCLAQTKLKRQELDGTLEEFARSHISGHEGVFGIVKMDGFRLVGSFDDGARLRRGAKVRMAGCGVRPDGTPFYRFAPAK